MAKAEETRSLIIHTFGELMKEKSVSEISIAEVCNICRITRPTFYRYFQDKTDVIYCFPESLLEKSLGLIGSVLSFRQGHMLWFSGFLEWKSFYHSSWQSCDYEILQTYLFHLIRETYLEILKEKKNMIPDDALTFQVNAISMVCSMLTVQWIGGGMEQTPEYLAGLLDTVIPSILRTAMEQGLL